MSYQAAVFLIMLMVIAGLAGLYWLLEWLKAKQEKELEEDGDIKN